MVFPPNLITNVLIFILHPENHNLDTAPVHHGNTFVYYFISLLYVLIVVHDKAVK